MNLNGIAFCLLEQYVSSFKDIFVFFSFYRLAGYFKKAHRLIVFVST